MSRASLFVLAAASIAACTLPARAQDTTGQRGVRIGLTYQAGTRPGVVVLPVRGPAGDSIRAILERDLDFGDRVTMVGVAGTAAAEAAQSAAPGGGVRVNYELLAKLGIAAIVQPSQTGSGLQVVVHDVAGKRVLQAQDFPLVEAANSRQWRHTLHGIADEIERWITGTRGIAKTRVLFVRDGRLHVVDSDGAEERALTGEGLALSPAWHPGGRHIAYVDMSDRGTQIVIHDLTTGRGRPLVATPSALNITPVFSPDGARIVYAHGEEEGTDLVVADPFSDARGRRITVGRGSDNVSPSFSPDGRRIAFTSGRSGHPEVYIMDADGANPELLTPFAFGDQYYRSNPDWSPDGRVIAFQSQIDGRFQIMTITLRDRTIRQLTSEGSNEDPSWAPDGRHLVFTSTRTGVRQLFVLDAETGRARQLTRRGGARLAAWSPRLDSAP